MAYDTELGNRVRALLSSALPIEEKHMFGGLAWLLEGRMFVGIVKDELMVRVGPERHDEAVARPHARIMDFTGKPMRGYIFVHQQGLRSDAELGEWLGLGLAFAATLPLPKPKAPRAATKTAKR